MYSVIQCKRQLAQTTLSVIHGVTITCTRNGTGKGGDGDSGWVFIRLPKLILKLQPESFLVTILDNVYNIHDGVELSSVKQNPKGSKYILFESILPVWKYGDPAARNWLYIVGISRTLGQYAYEFRFPKPKFDATLHHQPPSPV